MPDGPSAAHVDRFRTDLGVLSPPPGRLGIAVSGGVDSLALLLLAAAAMPGEIEAATVDHGLRPEAADEARLAASVCGRIGIAHETLALDAPIEGNIQSAAREARYRALGKWAERRDLAAILTAHQLDDQAETLLMRLLRGAGLAGLAGIRPVASGLAGERPVLRPLLGWRRSELGGIVAEAGFVPVEDPSNVDLRYDRARVRRHLSESAWLDPEPVARSAAALAEAEEAARWVVEGLWRGRVEATGDGFTLNASGLPTEFRRRLLVAILQEMALGPPPRGPEVTRLMATLARGGQATLAGVFCTSDGSGAWRFAPAPPRRG